MAKKKTSRGRSAPVPARPTRKGGLESASYPELQAEVRRRERALTSLQRKRKRLLTELAQVDRAIDGLGPLTGARSAHKRPRNPEVLVEVLKRVLERKTLSVSDAAGAAQRAGYRTTSVNFRTIVNQTLIGNRKTFKKVSRGMYTVRK